MSEMDLERELRAGLARVVEGVPALPRIGDEVVRRGRRRRRARTAGAVGALAAVLAGVLTLTSLGPDLRAEDPLPAAPTGAPQVPLHFSTGENDGRIVDWPGGERRDREIGGALPVALTPYGVLLEESDVGPDGEWTGTGALSLLRPDATEPERLMTTTGAGTAVSADGRRATVVVPDGPGRGRLMEVSLPDATELRSVQVPTTDRLEYPMPADYAGDGVLIATVRRQYGQGVAVSLWEPGDGQVIGELDEVVALDGAVDDDGRAFFAGAPAGRTCGTYVRELFRDGDQHWEECDEPFRGFSPGGRFVLTEDAAGSAVSVRRTADGDLVGEFAPGTTRAPAGWETASSFLLFVAAAGEDQVQRCVVGERLTCSVAAVFRGEPAGPQMIPPHLG